MMQSGPNLLTDRNPDTSISSEILQIPAEQATALLIPSAGFL